MLSLFRSTPPHSHPHPPPHHPLQILHQSLLRPSPHPRRPKKLVADKAVEYVKSNMVLGLRTGSTAAFVVDKLGALLKSGELTDIMGVLTSKRTQEQAAALGIPLSTLDAHPHLDLAIDGADEEFLQKMKKFAVKVEEGKKGRDGQLSVGPVYRNLLAEHEYPHVDPNLSTAWDIFRESVEKHSGNRMRGWRELVNGKAAWALTNLAAH